MEISSIKDYKIIKEILPSGAWANVYIAKYKGQIVALKVLKKELSTNAQVIENFFNEAEALAKFNQRNIAKLIAIGDRKFPYHFAMKYYPGGNLENFLKKHPDLSIEKAVQIVISIARALDAMNKKGFLHLDLKPHNILFDKFQSVVLTDFGAAKNIILSDKDEERQGTPQYMSPEHFDIEKELSFASDLYSLGVIFYRLVTGKLPFDSDNYQSLSVMHISKIPPKPSSINKKVNKKLDEIILKLLRKDAKARYSTALELIEELRKYQVSQAISNFKVEFQLYNTKGKLEKKQRFGSFPVVVKKGQKEKNVFTVYGGMETTNWIAIGKKEELLTVKSDMKGKLICNDEDYTTNEMLLYQNDNLLIFNNNLLRIKKLKKVPKAIIYSLVLFPLLIGLIYYYVNFIAKPLPVLQFSFAKSQVTVEEPISINVRNINSFGKKKIVKYKFAPYGLNKKDIRETKSLASFWTYPQKAAPYRETIFPFALKGIFDDGSETDWSERNIIVSPLSNKIKLSGLTLPSQVKQNQYFNYRFKVDSPYPKELLNVNLVLKDINGRKIKETKGVSLNALTYRYRIAKAGEYFFTVSVYSNDGVLSNKLVKKITVIPPIKPPNIIVNKFFIIGKSKLVISVGCSDPRYWQDSLTYELYLNNKLVATENGSKKIIRYNLPEPGEYEFYVKIVAPDKRSNKSKRYILNNANPILDISQVKFAAETKKLRFILKTNKQYSLQKVFLIINDNIQMEIDATKKFVSVDLNNVIPQKLYLVGYLKGKKITMTKDILL